MALSLSLGAAGLFALGVVLYFEGAQRSFYLYYFAPIGVPFVAFLIDRVARWPILTLRQGLVDLLVTVLALARALAEVPFISGHALFLTYALVTVRSGVGRITAALVLLQVIYLKIWVWRDPTLLGGAVLACLAALAYTGADGSKESEVDGAA